jgi:hypothetical protein
MRLTVGQARTAFLLLFLLLALPAGAAPDGAGPRHRASGKLGLPPYTARRIDLYSPRVRRSTVMYLRLRLLELREEGLERARAVIERRLSVDELLGNPARPAQKATEHPRRTDEP